MPGAKGVRYTFRSQLVANLFASLVVARGLMDLYALARARRVALAAVAAVTLLVLVEQINIEWPPTISRRETAAWIDAVPPPPPGCRVFYLVPNVAPADRPGWVHQAQAMLFAAVRGMPTVNGLSSWLPDGWDLEETDKPSYPAAVRAWAARKGIAGELCGLDPARATWTVDHRRLPHEAKRNGAVRNPDFAALHPGYTRSIIPEQLLQRRPECRRDVVARERIGDVGGEEADLRAAVEAAAFELQAVERLLLGEPDHRVGELDLAAGAALLGRQDVEDLRLQDVAAGDDEVGRRFGGAAASPPCR